MSLKIVFILASSADPKEMPLYGVFHLGPHCLPMYSKTCYKGPLKIDKTKVLKTNGSLMKVEDITEFSLRALFNTFDLLLGDMRS